MFFIKYNMVEFFRKTKETEVTVTYKIKTNPIQYKSPPKRCIKSKRCLKLSISVKRLNSEIYYSIIIP